MKRESIGMNSQNEASGNTSEKRSMAGELVRKLVTERNEVLVLFCRLAGLDPFEDKPARTTPAELLESFCQKLVDYIAAGHFILYDRILRGEERRDEIRKVAEEVYPAIASTTEAALDFNDKYNCGDHCQITNSLFQDLSKLGEVLAQRIELEDQLARLLCQSCNLRQASAG